MQHAAETRTRTAPITERLHALTEQHVQLDNTTRTMGLRQQIEYALRARVTSFRMRQTKLHVTTRARVESAKDKVLMAVSSLIERARRATQEPRIQMKIAQRNVKQSIRALRPNIKQRHPRRRKIASAQQIPKRALRANTRRQSPLTPVIEFALHGAHAVQGRRQLTLQATQRISNVEIAQRVSFRRLRHTLTTSVPNGVYVGPEKPQQIHQMHLQTEHVAIVQAVNLQQTQQTRAQRGLCVLRDEDQQTHRMPQRIARVKIVRKTRSLRRLIKLLALRRKTVRQENTTQTAKLLLLHVQVAQPTRTWLQEKARRATLN